MVSYFLLHLVSSTLFFPDSFIGIQWAACPSSPTIPRKYNSAEKRAADKVLRSQIRIARFFQRQARIERIRGEERARALAAELAERRRRREQQRQQLPVVVPPIAKGDTASFRHPYRDHRSRLFNQLLLQAIQSRKTTISSRVFHIRIAKSSTRSAPPPPKKRPLLLHQ